MYLQYNLNFTSLNIYNIQIKIHLFQQTKIEKLCSGFLIKRKIRENVKLKLVCIHIHTIILKVGRW